jgi:MoaA/NifB/PqqE/SkfB family radical SAM enzyme
MQLGKKLRLTGSVLKEFVKFDKKTVFFAVNNTCNSKCRMCSIWKNKNKKNVKYEDAKKALDILKKNNFKILQITGGEPFLNPDIFRILEYAKKIGFSIFVVTNGSMITEEAAEKIAKINVDQISVSFHHHDPKVFERIENHKNIFDKAFKGIQNLRQKKAHVSALCTISKYNMNDIEKTVEFIEGMNLYTSFCIPVTIDKTSFALGGDKCVNLTKEEMKDVILKIIEMKKRGHKIVNNTAYLRDVIDSLDGKSRYDCYGGSKLWFMDWNLKIYPCMSKGKGVRIEKAKFKDHANCNECLIQCFREPSMFLKSRRETIRLFFKDIGFYLRAL